MARSPEAQFFVKPGHASKDVEEVIEENERFLLVKKHVEQQEIARHADPRA
jgi:hypothetical protein